MPGHQSLADDIVNLGALVQRGHGVLKYHLNPLGNLPVQRPGDTAVDLLTVKDDVASRGGMDADDGAADGGFAGTGLTDQTEGFALINIKGYMIHGGKGMEPGTELNGQILNFQHFFALISHCGSLPSPAARERAPAVPPWAPGGPAAMCVLYAWV